MHTALFSLYFTFTMYTHTPIYALALAPFLPLSATETVPQRATQPPTLQTVTAHPAGDPFYTREEIILLVFGLWRGNGSGARQLPWAIADHEVLRYLGCQALGRRWADDPQGGRRRLKEVKEFLFLPPHGWGVPKLKRLNNPLPALAEEIWRENRLPGERLAAGIEKWKKKMREASMEIRSKSFSCNSESREAWDKKGYPIHGRKPGGKYPAFLERPFQLNPTLCCILLRCRFSQPSFYISGTSVVLWRRVYRREEGMLPLPCAIEGRQHNIDDVQLLVDGVLTIRTQHFVAENGVGTMAEFALQRINDALQKESIWGALHAANLFNAIWKSPEPGEGEKESQPRKEKAVVYLAEKISTPPQEEELFKVYTTANDRERPVLLATLSRLSLKERTAFCTRVADYVKERCEKFPAYETDHYQELLTSATAALDKISSSQVAKQGESAAAG